jgi:hypothetical protein
MTMKESNEGLKKLKSGMRTRRYGGGWVAVGEAKHKGKRICGKHGG